MVYNNEDNIPLRSLELAVTIREKSVIYSVNMHIILILQ